MPYNPSKHASAGYIDKKYKEQLKALADLHKRELKPELELLIQEAARKEHIE